MAAGSSTAAHRSIAIRELFAAEVDGWRTGQVVATADRARAVTLDLILELVLGVRDPGLRARLGHEFETLQTPANNLALFLGFNIPGKGWAAHFEQPLWSEGLHTRSIATEK